MEKTAFRPRTKLLTARKQVGLSQKKVADAAKITKGGYTNIELGRRDPSLKVAFRIATVLGKTVDELFKEEHEK